MPGTALAERPSCPASHEHGYMELRPLSRQTREQRWCGVWYDCSAARCHSSVLYPSPELRAQNAEQAARHRATCPGCDGPACRGRQP